MRIYFIDLIHPSMMNNTTVMPLGVGLIASYFQKYHYSYPEIEIFKLPDDLNCALVEQPLPDVACFSNWAWNQRLSLAYARHLKRLKSEMPIIMGGLNLPLDRAGREAFLRAHPEVDFHVIGEGERPVLMLLAYLIENGMDLKWLKRPAFEWEGCINLATDGQMVEGPRGHFTRISDIDDIPSPYLSGLMDKFFTQGLRPIIETARGCPFSCIFCAGAVESNNRVVHHSPAYIEAELEYIAHKMTEAGIAPDLIYADLNFGMFPQDIEKARIFRHIINRYGWPRTISGSTGKAKSERVMEAIEIINRGPNGEDQGILKFACSLQSTDPEVLTLCQRQNFPMDHIRQLMGGRPPGGQTEYFSELILGLPGDTKEKHFQSLRDCIDTLRLNLITTHQLMLLQGTPMATPEGRVAHGIKTRWRPLAGCAGIYRIGGEEMPIAELEEIAMESATMSIGDHIKCREMDLLTKVYIDRDGFIEIFGLIRRLGLSCFDLLLRVMEEWKRNPALSHLLKDFHVSTILPFFWDKEGALQFTSKEDNIRAILRGEFGTNELLVYRAKAMMEYDENIHITLLYATINYLRDHGLFNDIFDVYLGHAVRWSKLRKFNPNYWRMENGGGHTSIFCFSIAAEKGFEVLPKEIVLPSPCRYRFIYSPEMQSRISNIIAWWLKDCETPAQKDFAWGRLYHIINTKALDRTPVLVEESTTPG